LVARLDITKENFGRKKAKLNFILPLETELQLKYKQSRGKAERRKANNAKLKKTLS